MHLSTIPLKEVSSSNLKAVGCLQKDDGLCDVVVEFHDGSKYAYSDVPFETYEQLLNAESLGKFFNAEIRDKFDTEKLN